MVLSYAEWIKNSFHHICFLLFIEKDITALVEEARETRVFAHAFHFTLLCFIFEE